MTQVLNGPIETALRVITLLDAYEDVPLSREQLIFLDHALIHSADYDGPPSLHPALPVRESELTVKRSQINAALQLLVRAGLADIESQGAEVGVWASDSARPFLQLLETPYARRCRELARWTREAFGEASVIDLYRQIGPLGVRRVSSRLGAEIHDSTTEDR